MIVSGPEAAATLLRAEGKYPSRGNSVDNMMWIYKNIKKPYPMAFRYVSYRYNTVQQETFAGPRQFSWMIKLRSVKILDPQLYNV